jgi:hypothetical protein
MTCFSSVSVLRFHKATVKFKDQRPALSCSEASEGRRMPPLPITRDYSAAFATIIKNCFGTFHPRFNLEKVSFFVARLSCEGHDSTNFHQNVFTAFCLCRPEFRQNCRGLYLQWVPICVPRGWAHFSVLIALRNRRPFPEILRWGRQRQIDQMNTIGKGEKTIPEKRQKAK